MANRTIGKVKRLYVKSEGTNIRLENPESERPKDNYFVLDRDHSNYDSLYSLALAAAVNRLDLSIRTKTEITEKERAHVAYMVVDW